MFSLLEQEKLAAAIRFAHGVGFENVFVRTQVQSIPLIVRLTLIFFIFFLGQKGVVDRLATGVFVDVLFFVFVQFKNEFVIQKVNITLTSLSDAL